jgi:Family of unknown function (DUF5340)
MAPIPLPSHIHYELLLQLLERQSLLAAGQKPAIQDQVQQLIVTMRKAVAQQKHLEATCERHGIAIDYRWSLNGEAERPNRDRRSEPPSVEPCLGAPPE